MQHSCKAFVTASLIGLTLPGSATVSTYYINYYRSQYQTADIAPAGPNYYGFSAFLITSGPSEATAGNLTGAAGSLPMQWDNGTILVHYGPSQNSIAEMQASYPSGNYTFNITAGPLAPVSGTLPVAAIHYPNRDPWLDSGTYGALQNATANVAKPVSWGTFTSTGAQPFRSTSFNVVDMTEISLAHTNGGDQTYVGDTLAANKMKSGHRYFYGLVFNSYYQWPNQGFGTAQGSVSYPSQTTGYFNVKANPGTIAGKITLEANPYINGKNIRMITRRAGTSTVLDTRVISLGYEGYYAFEPGTTGMVDVYFKGDYWITKKVTNINLGVGQDNVNATLFNGDCNGDDVVDLTDYTRVLLAFNSISGNPGFDVSADLNGDGTVDLTDYTILVTNFNKLGDMP